MSKTLKDLGEDRGDYVYRAVDGPVEKVLDIGCAFGWTLGALTEKADHLVGVDMNEAALREARANYPHVEFIHQSGAALPCKANEFDVVILSEVIEHVGEENKQSVIDEVHRVLKEGGLFVFTAPYAGLFAWMDPMDFKRRFPGVYRLYMRLSGYEPKTPVEVGHEHVSLSEIKRLFGGRFEIQHVRYCGLLMPLISWVLAVDQRLEVLPQHWHEAINRFRGWESGIAYPRPLAFNIRLTARKRPA
jgi:SAM-dependent methyltransferase